MQEEMESVWDHFRNIIGPELQTYHSVLSTSQSTTLLEGYVGDILTVAESIKEKREVFQN